MCSLQKYLEECHNALNMTIRAPYLFQDPFKLSVLRLPNISYLLNNRPSYGATYLNQISGLLCVCDCYWIGKTLIENNRPEMIYRTMLTSVIAGRNRPDVNCHI